MNTEGIFDRRLGDTGNVVALEHVNLEIPDQRLATIFYLMGLGLTRDPYLFTGVGNMWVNAGRNQLHLPTGAPMVLRGTISLVMPDRAGLLKRLESVAALLAGSCFEFEAHALHVSATCPWGNRFRIVDPASTSASGMRLGLPSIELEVGRGTAAGIAAFYGRVMGARAEVHHDLDGAAATVAVGARQTFVYRETDAPPRAYDGHHVQIYVCDFSGPHRRLQALGLVTQEDDAHQYRFRQIVDPTTSKPLAMLEHEVRSLLHPLYGRPLINRNPNLSNRNYAPGEESFR